MGQRAGVREYGSTGVRSPATSLWKRMWSKLRAILNILLRLLQIIEIHFVYSKHDATCILRVRKPRKYATRQLFISELYNIYTCVRTFIEDESHTLITWVYKLGMRIRCGNTKVKRFRGSLLRISLKNIILTTEFNPDYQVIIDIYLMGSNGICNSFNFIF